MATNAPASMGFNLQAGSNMHINLEPHTQNETERLFHELSAGGTVSMPLQQIFGAATMPRLLISMASTGC
jgi:uncharacterized glyoxalase superfamily protein PhnB